MTHFVNFWTLVFQPEWATCSLPTDITGNLESGSRLFLPLWPFFTMHSGAPVSQLRMFRLAPLCPWGYHSQTHYTRGFTRDPATSPWEFTSWSLGFRWFPNPGAKVQKVLVRSLIEAPGNRERIPAGLRGSAHLAPRSLPGAHFPPGMCFENRTKEAISYLDSHICAGCFCGIRGCLISL